VSTFQAASSSPDPDRLADGFTFQTEELVGTDLAREWDRPTATVELEVQHAANPWAAVTSAMWAVAVAAWVCVPAVVWACWRWAW